MNKIGLQILNSITFILVLIGYFSYERVIEIGNNLNVSLTFFIFPLVYLLLIVINNFYTYRDAKNTIKNIFISLLVFVFLMIIFNLIPSNLDSIQSEVLLKSVFTPNNISLFGLKICYPNLIYLITYTLLGFITCYIMIAIYNAINRETKEFIAYYLSVFISSVLFTIILLSVDSLLISKFTFKSSISFLTAGFIVTIASSIITLIIHLLIKIIKK